MQEIKIHTKISEQKTGKPLVSVIVPTFNSALTLEDCLSAIALQTYPNIEIIVVDNYSNDSTIDSAKKFTSEVFQINELRSAARNYGAKKALGDYLLFIDADMKLTPNIIDECVYKSTKLHVDAIMIPEIRVVSGFWGKCRAIERLTYIGDPLIESPRFFERTVFERIGGFDEDLEAGEDWDLHARVEDFGYDIKSISAHIKHNEGHFTLRKIVMKRYYYGKTLMKYIEKHPERAKVQFMPIRLNYIKHWKLLASQPIYSAGMLFMKAIEYFVTGVSIIVH